MPHRNTEQRKYKYICVYDSEMTFIKRCQTRTQRYRKAYAGYNERVIFPYESSLCIRIIVYNDQNKQEMQGMSCHGLT